MIIWESTVSHDDIVNGTSEILKNSYSQDAFQKSMDENKKIAGLYKIRGLPTNYFINPDLIISKITIGWVNENQIQDEINKMKGSL